MTPASRNIEAGFFLPGMWLGYSRTMAIVALTGGIGSGKSLAARYFADLGARVIDADQLSREVIERGSEGFDEVLAAFGDSILRNGEIDRRALSDLIFADTESKRKLEGIIHPRVRRAFEEAVSHLSSDEILIYEIPLLVETGAADRFDYVITVESDLDARRARLQSRGMLLSEIEARFQAQANSEDRESLADYVIHNNSTKDALFRQVENLWENALPHWQRGRG